ncbi:DNA-binding protein Fis / transcriptional regulator, Fis family [Shewanella denitrificans OS217]|uniref:DNA-binding protein Fis / transcriptional regulator, Fis family n=1 Tax=Shewanella denitrificans (strain OS217 / ATCC BAA-1090 / DSM 15013) TaxID=318161 RepID=Q12K16_SHEDO|nr:sigma 54-interacting transcriptional regulator [Shewanella denitrificans]ABE56210.1 DNA-binding protein Fis / transcriptional regulator, Fis family [Shewanella denitrificans OS217]
MVQKTNTTTSSAHFLPENTLLLDAVGEGIYGFDLQGNAVFINPAAQRMTGWRNDELLGKNIHNCHHHSHADGSPYPQESCPIYQTLKDGVAREVAQDVFWRKDGSSFPVLYSSTPVYQGSVMVGVIAIFRDISVQKQTELSLRQALNQVQALSEQLAAENHELQQALADKTGNMGIKGSSPVMAHLLQQIHLVANTNSTVLICGESGTGKELVARNLHQLSRRKHKLMVSVNCAAFSPSLLESELFGHEKGAFTGANTQRKGKFEQADKGTLFLDEVAELSLEAQSKLLRVIQEQEFQRLGGSSNIKIDIRLIAASHHNLLERVEQGLFRMDLYYRLNVFPIHVPPLRDRLEDMPELVESMLLNISKKLAKKITCVSQAGMAELKAYHWPGNVRELQNILEREAILSQASELDIHQLPFKELSKIKPSANRQTLAQAQATHIRHTLEQLNWQISGEHGAAKQLGLPASTLRSKMQKLGIVRQDTTSRQPNNDKNP